MSREQQPIEYKDFHLAVADSPLFGHAQMKNIDIELFKGSMVPQRIMITNFITTETGLTFTAVAATDVCTASANIANQVMIDASVSYQNAAVTFTTTGTLPAGLATGTIYFLIKVTDTTFKVATSYDNAAAETAIDITDTGSGVHTIVPVPIGTVKWIIKAPLSSQYYALGSNGRVWFDNGAGFALITGNTLGSGNGLAAFANSDRTKSYLMVFRDNKVDIMDTANVGTPNWTNNWQTINSSTQSRSYTLLARNNMLYFTNGRYIGFLRETPGSVFDPANSATFTFNSSGLTLPQDAEAYCIEEQGSNLYIGDRNTNKIFYWDKNAISYNGFLVSPEKCIFEIKNLGNILYIFAGFQGIIYYVNGNTVKEFKKIPGYLSNNAAAASPSSVTWGGAAIKNGAILIGVSTTTSGNSGVYIVYPDGRILQDNTSTSGSGQISAIYAGDLLYRIGFVSGLDIESATNRPAVATYRAVYQTELSPVGNKTKKGAISEIEVQLARIPTSGRIRISYRTNLSSSWTVLTGMPFSADSVNKSFSQDIGLTDLEDVQFQVEFDSDITINRIIAYP